LPHVLEAQHYKANLQGAPIKRRSKMFCKPVLAVAALALMSGAAFAQGAAPSPDTANGPPAQLSGGNPGSDADGDMGRDMDRDTGDDRDLPPPPPAANRAPPNAQAPNVQAQDQSRDLFCRRDAAARTGYVTPGEAASHEQTAGSVGGTLTGAALGAIIGGASHAAGPGALIGAGAGLIAGTAIGSENARPAAADVEHAYSDAYYACMSEADDRGPPPGGYPSGSYAYGPPPPPAYYAPYPYPYYYPPYYYGGPRVVFGFGFGGGWHGGFRGGFHGHR
jgi:hypothetical protein